MIRVVQLEVGGISSAGRFRGRLAVNPGLHVVSADNAFGKTLSSTVIGWCLGLEPMFGVRDDDPIRFPMAAREVLDLEGHKGAKVISSYASLTLLRHDGAIVCLARDIVGDPKLVRVEEISPDVPAQRSVLVARYHTLKDESGGLQNFLYKWTGLPREKVLTHRGEEADVYLENIAPHFFIDQTEGWSSIQALQVSRYGQQDIDAASVEYLLGAHDALVARIAEQTALSVQSRLKATALELAIKIVRLFEKQGWPLQWSSHGTVAEVATRWSKSALKEVARKEFRFDLVA